MAKLMAWLPCRRCFRRDATRPLGFILTFDSILSIIVVYARVRRPFEMVVRVRNKGCFPYLGTEGQLVKLLPREGENAFGSGWQRNLTVFQRLNGYHTLASVRRYAHFKPFPGLIPKDALDLVLASSYDHGTDVFPEKIDVVLQDETLGVDTWRRLRNTKDIKPEKDAISAAAAAAFVQSGKKGKAYVSYDHFHPLYVGGITERKHPSNVKLMNSSHHSPQTNAGYSRQDSDGNAYQY